MVPVPTLDELAADPSRAGELPADVAWGLLARLLAVQTALLARLPLGTGNAAEGPGEDHVLTVAEAAETLGVSVDWLYRRADKLSFTVRLGKQVRFSARGIERYIRQRQGR